MKFTILSIVLFFIVLRVAGQQNIDLQQDYYQRFWKTNADSLLESWAVKKQFSAKKHSPEAVEADMTQLHALVSSLNTSLPRKEDARVLELLNFYLKNKALLEIAFSRYDHLDTIFRSSLKEKSLPQDLSLLPVALSAMNNKAIGETGAGGLWQIMYANGRRQSLRIDSYIDQRRNIQKAAKAAAAELDLYFKLYQDWELALAAYSCGATNVNKAIRRNDNKLDFYTIYKSLPAFGQDIVPALTALMIINQNRDKFNIHPPQWSLNIDVDTIEVSQRLHFAQIEAVLQIPVPELRYLNPQYKYDIVPAINEVFTILLPKGSLAAFNQYEDSIYHYKDTVLFNLKKPVVLPPPAKGSHYARYEPELPPDNSALLYYTIKSGDNLGFIASWYNVKVRQLEDWNNIYDPRRLKLGRKLKVYVPEDKVNYYRPVDKMSFEEKQRRVGKAVSASGKQKPKEEEPLGPDFFWYTVKSGESPYTIAKKYPGVSADDILRWNNIKDPRSIRVGQKLKIKKVK